MPVKQVSPINEDFDLKLFITIARKNAWWFAIFMLSSALIALLILRYTAPVFEASSVIKINIDDKVSSVLNTSKSNDFYDSKEIAGDIELIRSKLIVERAVNKLPLQISYYSQGAVLDYELYTQTPFLVEAVIKDSSVYGHKFFVDFIEGKKISLSYQGLNGEKTKADFLVGKWFTTPYADLKITVVNYAQLQAQEEELKRSGYYFILRNTAMVADGIIKEMLVTPLNIDAKTILVKMSGENISMISDIVNAVSKEFIAYDTEKNTEVANRILDFIDRTINAIDVELSNSETSIEQFKRTNKIISPEQAVSDVTANLNDARKNLEAINFELELYKNIRKDLDRNSDINKFILSLSGSADDNNVINELGKLQTLIDEKEIVETQSTSKSDVYKIIEQKIQKQKELLIVTIANEEKQLLNKRIAIRQHVDDYEYKFGKLPAQQAEYGRLQRFFNVNEKFYSLLLDKKAEFSITKAGYVPQHIILQDAKSNSKPVSPNKTLIISSCLMIGFVGSLILIIVRYLLYNEINALEEIGLFTDAALLGIIPKYKREIPVSQLLVDINPKSVISEAFRSIRTNLQFISLEEGSKVMAVTSTISGEGKTFNAINLAGVIAFSGKRVVILDLDMRKPKIHIGFNVENNHGMSTILIGKDRAEDCIMKSAMTNLDFITAGPIPPNPAELIINPRMDQLLEMLKEKYDVIICDTPPVGIVSDGLPIMQKADYPLYILRANYSRKMFVTQINKLMSDNKINRLSIILNGVEMSRIKYGYGYGYSYGYGYGYGYSYGYGYYEEDDKPKNIFERIKGLLIRK